MTAAAEARGDPAHVHVALAAKTDLHGAVTLPQQAGDSNRSDRARIVHEVFSLDERLGHEAGRQREPCHAAVDADLDAREGLAEPPQRLARPLLVDVPG